MLFAIAGDLCLTTHGDDRRRVLDGWLHDLGMGMETIRALYAAMCTYMGTPQVNQQVQLMVEAWLFSQQFRRLTTKGAHLCAWFGTVSAVWTSVIAGAVVEGQDQDLHARWITFLLDTDSRKLPQDCEHLVPTTLGLCTSTSGQEHSPAREMPGFFRLLLTTFPGQRRTGYLEWAPRLWTKWEPSSHVAFGKKNKRLLPLHDPEQRGLQAFLKRKHMH